ncbi:photosystem II extrinsic protein PsbU [Nitzschia inconspicua]|uniref:Photosystem II 12 kDa extrinsic protein n=1 Tax=Nitzschia inconspicua TaxID=303405 RepID=A0A9K3L650_9STRA|nr:photosystem II extrinsic protein PsbU [Nitzschia inconspicua]KAG7361710.1 photosystem II extrinsic protein PsbU [Nitzschia inconspicua]
MRTPFLLLCCLAWTAAFAPLQRVVHLKSTRLGVVSRRDAMGVIAAGALFPEIAHAFSQQLDDYAFEPQQQATDGKWDLNSAFVADYKYFPGMFPTSAGKIASHGPYEKVSDIYKIPGLTDNDIKNFKKYEKYFTVNPPGRSFYERINNRVST